MTTIADRYQTIADLASRGNLSSAEQHCRQMMQASSDPELFYMLAVIKGRQDDYPAAQALFEEAVQHLPERPDILYNYGVICQAGGDLERAVTLWQRATVLDPDLKDAHYNLGKALCELKRLDQAETAYRHALSIFPDDAQTLYNLGNLKFQRDEFKAAENLLRLATQAAPSWSDPWVNLGMSLSRQGRHADAERCYGEALQRNPENAEAHWNRALTLVLNGNYQQGWQEYEWRFKRDKWRSFYPYRHTVPRWDGRPFPVQRLLVHDEQGLGDTLQFMRYLPMVKALGGTVIFETKDKLLALLKNTAGADAVVSRSPDGNLDLDYDLYVPLLSLPAIFGTTWQTVPDRVPYLLADKALVRTWAPRLRPISGLKVGICWQGNPAYGADRQRSVPLKFFAPLARMKNVQLISLQKIHGLDQLARMPSDTAIIDLGSELDEDTGVFMDTAAVMQNLDLIITSDTAIPHLAGALGVPVWLTLPHIPDWRWGLSGENYPWYPTMRVFRQSCPGDWEGLFRKVSDALKHLIQ
jgi:Flp pilus assembly protein TadD